MYFDNKVKDITKKSYSSLSLVNIGGDVPSNNQMKSPGISKERCAKPSEIYSGKCQGEESRFIRWRSAHHDLLSASRKGDWPNSQSSHDWKRNPSTNWEQKGTSTACFRILIKNKNQINSIIDNDERGKSHSRSRRQRNAISVQYCATEDSLQEQ